MKKLIFLGFTIFLCAFSAKSQDGIVDGAFGYYKDALLFGRTQSIGTARTQAIGGAQVALGGDVNSAYANPAGLGFNRSSVVTFTPSLNFFESDTEYFGTTTPDFKTNLNFANLGVVFNLSKSDIETSKFKGGSFAITLTRESNFHQDYNYDGVNTTEPVNRSSIVESWMDEAWDIHPDDLTGLAQVAFNQYLINDYAIEDNSETIIGYGQFIGYNPRQVEVNQVSGSQYQWDFAYGGNYDDILYFGAGLNISSIKNKTESKYIERDFDNNSNLHSITLNNSLDLRGTGVSASAGLIARPSDYFRIGVSVVSPTYYEMTEESTMSLETEYNVTDASFEADLSGEEINVSFDDNVFYDEFDPYTSSYSLKTPGKITLGGAFFLGKIGFVSADVDFVNHSGAKLKSEDFTVTEDNQTIKNFYQNTTNFRVGTEIRLDVFRLRGGYSYQGDPYTSDDIDGSLQQFSGGLGYRNKQYFVDLAATHSTFNTQRSPYFISSLENEGEDLSPVAYTENRNLNLSVTVGFNF